MRTIRTAVDEPEVLGGPADPGPRHLDPEPSGLDPGVFDGWSAFPVHRRPRPIVLIGAVLQQVGYTTGEAKDAVAAGRLELAAALPQVPPRMAVRLPGGTFELPTLSAKAAFAAARAAGTPTAAAGPALRIGKVSLGTARFPTDRGQLILPAWRFHAAEALAPLAIPALDPSVFWQPGRLQYPTTGASEVTTDGRLLTVATPGPYPPPGPGEPYERYVPVVAESATAVAVGLRTEIAYVPAGGTDDDGLTAAYTVRLSAPLGNRVAIDGEGNPLPVVMA